MSNPSWPVPEEITIPVTEYEALQRDSRRVKAIENILEELRMRRSLLSIEVDGRSGYTTRLITLRKKAIAKINLVMNRGWNG